MIPFSTHSGIAAALRRDNIDTDIIIPMEELLTVPFDGLGRVAFRPIRFSQDGSDNPEFIFNQPAFRDATILIAGRNFGSGSSREAAVNGIAGMGIRTIIAPSFGDIFYGNCFKNGLLPIQLDEATVAALMDMADSVAGTATFAIDLPGQKVTAPLGDPIPFLIESGLKQRLLAGEDDIAVTLKLANRIKAFQDHDRSQRPWIWAIEREDAPA